MATVRRVKMAGKDPKLNFVLYVLVGGIIVLFLYNHVFYSGNTTSSSSSSSSSKGKIFKGEKKVVKSGQPMQFLHRLQSMEQERLRAYVKSGTHESFSDFKRSVMTKFDVFDMGDGEIRAVEYKAEIKTFRLKRFKNRFKRGNTSAVAFPTRNRCKPEVIMFPPPQGRKRVGHEYPFPKRIMFATFLNRRMRSNAAGKMHMINGTRYVSIPKRCIFFVEDVSKYKKMKYKKMRAEVFRDARKRKEALPRIY